MSRGLFGIRRRKGDKPVAIPARARFDVDTQLEQRQEIERRILVADGKNVDRPRRLIEDQPDYGEPQFHWSFDANGSPV